LLLGNFPGGHGAILDGKERTKTMMKGSEALNRIQLNANSNKYEHILDANERYYIYQADDKPFAPLIAKLPRKYR
jgi:hypothetical protein